MSGEVGSDLPWPPAKDEVLRVRRLHDRALLPYRASAGAAGYDLHSAEAAVVPAGRWALVDTGIAIEPPFGTYGRVAPRSGLAARGLAVGAGVIDADYRGAVKVLLFNHGPAAHEVRPGDRVAQLVLEVARTPPVLDVTAAESALSKTARGAGGFGSTGGF